jgi:hypothetical protein
MSGGRWLYLVFFNCLWVAIPFWLLYEAYGVMVSAMKVASSKKSI